MASLARRAVLRSLPLALAPAAKRFGLALRQPGYEQRRLRRRFARELARTAYGRALGVRHGGDWNRVPVVDYDTLAPWLDRQRAEEGAIVTPERVRFYEKTSGSSGRAKYIPYTAAKQQGLRELFAAWAYDVLRRGPKLRTGRIYLSVSPRFGARQTTPTGRPVGLEHDGAYLGRALQALLGAFWAGPRPGVEYRDADGFLTAVAESLAATRDLEIVSVWNPSLFEVVLDRIADLHGAEPDWVALWPELRLVSCWDAAAAAPMAERLRRRLPHALLQGKGLLATEAVVTVPWIRAGGCVPFVHHTLVELLTDDGAVLPLVAAQVGTTYEVVVSTAGGLVRYRLGDRVRVTHRYGRVPCLVFVGRAGGVSDLVGEKLHEAYVARILDEHLPRHGFLTLLPVLGPPAHYALVSDRPVPRAAIEAIEASLSEAHHYGLARSLGQLARLRGVVHRSAAHLVTAREARRGLRLGDVKPRALQLQPADTTLLEQLGSLRAPR
ncbi:MAG: GH3 auxin-responsive promoter family protein [Myxococcota bacterium]